MESFSLQGALHFLSQGIMIPTMLVLVILILFVVYSLGALVVELITERRHFKSQVPQQINAIFDAPYDKVTDIICKTSLLNRQKEALMVTAENMGLSDEDLFSLAKAELAHLEDHYSSVVKRTDLVAKIGPMMGLVCTLIPLGPGIVAMGQGDVEMLSASLLVAFDGTVAGLIAAVVAMLVSQIRKRWYAQYMTSVEAVMSSILDKAEQARKAGVELPHETNASAQTQSADIASAETSFVSTNGYAHSAIAKDKQ